MLGDILAEIIGEIIGEVIYNLILKPIGLLLFCIFKAIFNFGKWSWQHIAAAAAFVTSPIRRLFKREKKIDIMEGPETISELASATVDDTRFSARYNDR